MSYLQPVSDSELKDNHHEHPPPPPSTAVSEAVEKVEIVQMDNAARAPSERDGNVLDVTVTCQGR